MQNPFESGHIKNYLLFYGAIVAIMILFFIASTLFHEVEQKEKKIFATQKVQESHEQKAQTPQAEEPKRKFELLDTGY